MTRPTLADHVVETLRKHRAELHRAGIRKLSLFGSVARGEETPTSDLDLAAELDPAAEIGLFGLGALERRVGDLVGRRVDLLPEPAEKERLRAAVERDRRIVF